MKKYRFFLALLSVWMYDTLIQLVNPASGSALKIAITLLVWISVYQSVIFFISKYRFAKAKIPSFTFKVFILLIVWNLINIARSFLGDDGTITTLFGNPCTSLALLVPSLIFGTSPINLKFFNDFIVKTIILCLFICLILFFFFTLDISKPNNVVFLIVSKIVFLITIFSFHKPKDKVLILIATIFLLYISIVVGNRTMLIRISLLFTLMYWMYFYKNLKYKWMLIAPFLILLLPFYLLQSSIFNNESAFERYLSQSKSKEMSSDTRTFLYIETYSDLEEHKSLIWGKGSNATYYSEYFSKNEGDSSNRLSVEVGILAILLKGGFIAVILTLILLFSAIYLAFFKSNNVFVIGVGFMLLVHTILLFVENILSYSVYNFTIWFFIGFCLSKEIRSYNTKQIINILTRNVS